MLYKLWELSEHANWNEWFPKVFWLWSLQKLDKYHGFRFQYNEKK